MNGLEEDMVERQNSPARIRQQKHFSPRKGFGFYLKTKWMWKWGGFVADGRKYLPNVCFFLLGCVRNCHVPLHHVDDSSDSWSHVTRCFRGDKILLVPWPFSTVWPTGRLLVHVFIFLSDWEKLQEVLDFKVWIQVTAGWLFIVWDLGSRVRL